MSRDDFLVGVVEVKTRFGYFSFDMTNTGLFYRYPFKIFNVFLSSR